MHLQSIPFRWLRSRTWSRAVLLSALVVSLSACTTELADDGEESTEKTAAPVEAEISARYLEDPMVNPDYFFEPQPEDASKIDQSETLLRNIQGNPKQLNPVFSSSAYEQELDFLLFDTLFNFDKDLEWSPNEVMVKSVTGGIEDKTWEIELQPNLTWNDGAPLTAEDVKFSWEIIIDPRVQAPAVKTGTLKVENVEVLSPTKLTMTFKEIAPTNIWNALFPIVPKHIFSKDREKNPDMKSGDWNNKHNREVIVSNGRYRLVEWIENQRIVLERWDDYPGPKAPFQRIIGRLVREPNVRLLSFCKGNLDEFQMTDEQFAKQTGPGSEFDQRGGAKVLAQQWTYSYIGWNMDGSNPFFTDQRVRQALAHAFDQREIIANVLYDLQTPCYGVFHPQSKWFSPKIAELRIGYDLDKAGKLLDEAGWKIDRDQGGYRYKEIDGKPVKFEFTCLVPQESQNSPRILARYQETLKQLGIEMLTRRIEWASFLERVREHNFEAQIAAWGTGADPYTLENLWHSSEYKEDGSGRNYGKYANDRVDELLVLSRQETDAEKRVKQYQELSELIYQDQPYLFISNRMALWGVDKRFRGIQYGPRGLFSFNPGAHSWWIPAKP